MVTRPRNEVEAPPAGSAKPQSPDSLQVDHPRFCLDGGQAVEIQLFFAPVFSGGCRHVFCCKRTVRVDTTSGRQSRKRERERGNWY